MEQIKMIPIEKLHPHPQNPRRQLGDVTELAASIRANGIMQNLTVVPKITSLDGDYIVVIGHRRLAAAKMAGLSELPCVVAEMDLKTQIATMLLENMQRRELTVYEEASGMQMMIDFGDSYEDIAGATGLSQSTVRRRVRLLRKLGDEGLRSACGKQIDITVMERIAELNDDRAKEKALAAAGTGDFDWTMRRLLDDQQRAQTLVDLKAAAELFAKPGTPAGLEYRRARTFYDLASLEDWPREKGREYIYNAAKTDSFPFVTVYELYTEAELLERNESEAAGAEREAADTAETEAAAEVADDPEERRLRELQLLEETAEQCRADFIRMLTAVEVTPSNRAMEFTVRILMLIDAELEHILLDKFSCDDAEELFNSMRASAPLAARVLAVATFECADHYLSIRGYVGYNGDHCEDPTLDALYEALGVIGYEMSTEERQLADGTHKLYFKDKGRK